jgi:hypothetical protein
VAAAEFDPAPSVVVVCDGTPRQYRVTAHVSHLFTTLDGESRFEFPLARVSQERAYVVEAYGNGDQPAHKWRPVDADGDLEALVTESTAAMVVSLVSAYWTANGVRWRLGEGATSPLGGLLAGSASDVSENAVVHRLMGEIEALETTCGEVSLEPLGEDSMLLLADAVPGVFLEIGRDYPTEPPRLWRTEQDGTYAEIVIPAADWSPERSLVEVLSGVRAGVGC